ncbi:MAG: TlpA family protein disulfide reductase [Tidjanibacter sp.]|nr:TlpA family protein disulfide reductase [Tidjanibacter sp.]
MMKKISIFALSLIALCGCNNNQVTVEGEFAACPNETVILERVSEGGGIVADSVATSNLGAFKIKVSLPEGEPTFYNLRCGERNIPLILASGEKVEVKSIPCLIDGYTIRGSKESELVKEVKNIMGFGVAKLDSMTTLYNQTKNKKTQELINKDYTAEYYNIKREQIGFIVKNAGSLAAIYALNQRIPGDDVLFGSNNDIIYFRLVAEEVAKNYPTSPYLVGLQATIDQYDQQVALADKINKALSEAPANFPEVELPDMYGKKQSLTAAQQGKVLLLDFWSLGDQNATFRNAELKEIYAQYKDKGFEIYQVSVDTSKPAWVEGVQTQKLPWISVCDFKGANSIAVQLYGVVSIPQNFLLDREGNIVAMNAYGDDLKKELARLMK